MRKITEVIEKITEITGTICSWFSFILVLLVVMDVAGRYLFSVSFVAVQELQWHIFSLIFLGAGAYTLKHKEHVRVDIFYSRLNPSRKAWIDIIGTILFLLPFAAIVIYASVNFVKLAYLYGEQSPDPGGLPYRFIIKSILPISFILVCLQAIVLLLDAFKQIKPGGK